VKDKFAQGFGGNLKEMNPLEDLVLVGRIILECVWKK
jgi:hypothetical protein